MTHVVLIVDDSLTVRMDLAEAFETAGFRVVSCENLMGAREALGAERIDLAILDVMLPDGHGTELLTQMRSSPEHGDTPVLMLSSEAEVKDRIRGFEQGATDYVGKPYDAQYVIARAHELLRSRRARSVDGRRTVLVIDDSPTFRDALRRALESAGYSVVLAANGEDGLRMAGGSRPDAIIVDGVMPGIDGATVIRNVRLDPALRTIPCVLLTGSEDADAELRALDSGADTFARKDDDLEPLLVRLRTLLRESGMEPNDTPSLLGPKRLLAVDDSPTYLNELSSLLRTEGYEVVQASSGEEAIELLAVQSIDCVLLDLVMPGLGGRETCRRIKSTPPLRDVPLIMLTALDDRDAMIDGLLAGADDYVSKSSDLQVLKARVRAQIRRKQFEDEHRRMREDLLRSELDAAETRAARQLAQTKAALVEELERKNKELEAFSYSVSHDLRAPLRSIDGFSQALIEDYAQALDDRGRDYLRRVRAAAQRMGDLIDDLLELSKVSRAELQPSSTDLSAVAEFVAAELARRDPDRSMDLDIAPGLRAFADPRLLRIVLENLLGNAWKFTGKTDSPRIEVGVLEPGDSPVFFVRDNGAGFKMDYAHRLFSPFQRLHGASEFPGTGIGLATVARIVDRHGGRVWAEAAEGSGATIFFTFPQRTAADGQGP